ncbi:hypothetical protein DAMA08_008720 [Martiniozyma asiatica (nom. inval.)]|nr:hypothetical protein DAMA08_008720 [Martiniozyma asiatica]
MLSRLAGVRTYATEAGNSMEGLMKKLSTISEEGANSTKKTYKKKGNFNKARAQQNTNKKRSFNSKNFNEKNNRRRNNNGDRRKNYGDRRSREEPPRTISIYDRLRNPKPRITTKAQNGSKGNEINGINYKPSATFQLLTQEEILEGFKSSNKQHADLFKAQSGPLAQFNKLSADEFVLQKVDFAKLNLTKDKFANNHNNRVLRALEQLTTKRGYRLDEFEKRGQQYDPMGLIAFPFANPLAPTNLLRKYAQFGELSNISENEIKQTFASVVYGVRPELVVDLKKDYKTEAQRVNAHAVVNSLNSNPTLHVDSLHKEISKVLLGNEPIKNLPKPVLPPKKI